jgi:surface protein
MYQKKGINSIIAILLLLSITVLAVLGYLIWYNSYSSKLFSNNIDLSNKLTNLNIENLIGGELYIKNDNNYNVTLKNVEISGIKCTIQNINLTKGINNISVNSCLGNVSSNPVDVVLITSFGLYSKKIFIKDFNSLSSKTQSLSINDPNFWYVKNFTTLWNVTIANGLSGKGNLSLPLQPNGLFNFTVCWGDGTCNYVTSWNDSNAFHTYGDTNKLYKVNITGVLRGFPYFNVTEASSPNDINNYYDGVKLLDVLHWGGLKLDNNSIFIGFDGSSAHGAYFAYCFNLKNFSADDKLDTSLVTNMFGMFIYDAKFNGDISYFNTTKVTNMTGMFAGASSFNQPLDSWDVSHVINMSAMFVGASSFNQSLDNWNVSQVIDMASIFYSAGNFTQNLTKWNTSSVAYCSYACKSSGIEGKNLLIFNYCNETTYCNTTSTGK